MGYNKEVYEKALNEIKRRKQLAEDTAKSHKNRLNSQYPEFAMIDAELSKTGIQIAEILSLPPQKAEQRLNEIKKRNSELQNEKIQLLKKLGLPENYLDVNYTCEKCKDTGFYEERSEDDNVSYGMKLCSCHIDLLKSYAMEKMSKISPLELSSFDDFDLGYYSKNSKDGKPSPYEVMNSVYKKCVSYACNFDLDSVNLFFYGRTGLGKTHLSLSIANEVVKKGYNVVYGSVINFLNQMEKEKFGRTEDLDTENILISADLLILDDLGAEFSTPLTTSMLYNLLNSRICKGLPTIISSNLSLQEVKERYPESVASRIIGTYALVSFAGDDIRQLMNS